MRGEERRGKKREVRGEEKKREVRGEESEGRGEKGGRREK